MAAPSSAATPLTDEQLKTLIGTATQEDIDLLSDEEAARLGALIDPPQQSMARTPIENVPGRVEPKGDIATFERNKRVAETPRVSLPTSRGPTQPLPHEGPKDLKSFLASLGEAAMGGADRPAEAPQQPQPDPLAATEMNNPAALGERVRAQQDQLIGANQPMSAFRGPQPSETEALAQILPSMLTEQVASLSEFALNPMRQLATRPIEFGGNVLMAATSISTIRTMGRAAQDASIAAEAAQAIKVAPSSEILGAHAAIETKLDEVSALKEMNREMGGDPEMAERLRALEAQLTKTQEVIAETKGPLPAPPKESPFEVGDTVKHKNGNTYEVTETNSGPGGKYVKVVDQTGEPQRFHPDWLTKAEPPTPAAGAVSEATATAQAMVKLPEALSLTGPGTILLAGAVQDDKEDQTPRHGSPLALKNALWAVPAGIFAFGVARYFTSPAFRAAVNQFTRLDKSRPADLERVFETLIVPMLPDTPMTGKSAPMVGMLAGAGVGGLVGSKAGQDEINPAGAIVGALAGGALGAVGGGNFAKQFRTALTPQQLYRMYFTEAAGMSDSAVAAKYATRAALEGRIREIRDVSNALDALDVPTRGLVQSWMAGNASMATVPAHARWDASYARLLFDELTLDLLSSGLIKDKVLRETLTTNMGTYVPRLMLRYELDDRPREIVEQWLRSQGKGWGYISSKNYLKAKADLPPDVLRSLGEITDNPGYLLAKRGTITAADVEQARYHRFLLSSPENALPSKLVRQQRKAAKAQKATIATGGQVTAPTQVRFYHAESGMEAAEWQGRTYWKMPDNPRYGLVRGQFVEHAVASDIISTHETATGLQKLFQAPLSTFKFFKAVFNPASQFRNMVTNAMFADIEAGVAPWRMDKWGRAAEELRSTGKMYRQARRDGVFGGEFTTSEIQNLLDPHLKGSSSMMEFIGETVPRFASKPAEFFMKWHQTSEAHARLTVYTHAIESLGMDGPTAAKFARRTIPDYQDVQRWVKVVRSSPFGAPFISFSYKALPRSFEAAVAFGDPKKMMRFWKYPLAMAALNEYSAQQFGLLGKDEKADIFSTLRRTTLRTLSAGTYSPDGYDTFRKYLPNHVGNMQITIPWRDQYDRPQYLDGTFFLPWGDAGEMGKGDLARGTGMPWLPRQIEPSNPWFQLGIAAMTGKDSFTGRDVAPAGSVGVEHLAGWGKFLLRAWGPSLTPYAGYGAESLGKSFSGDYASDPNVKTPGAAVMSEILGARTRPVDPASSYKFRVFELRKSLDANRSEIIRLARYLQATDEVGPDTMDRLLESNPSKALVRAISRRKAILQKFQREYPADEIPPSPEALVRAIQSQGAK